MYCVYHISKNEKVLIATGISTYKFAESISIQYWDRVGKRCLVGFEENKGGR